MAALPTPTPEPVVQEIEVRCAIMLTGVQILTTLDREEVLAAVDSIEATRDARIRIPAVVIRDQQKGPEVIDSVVYTKGIQAIL